jgi:hypothetical protein
MQEGKTPEAPATTDTMVAALLRERESLVARGLDDRVSQVDEQLKLRDYNPDDAPKGSKPRRTQQTR